jgi:hypothetical protein
VRQQTGRRRAVPILAWGLCVLFVVMWLLTLALHLSGSGRTDQVLTVLAGGYAVVGALVAVREPRNAVGWLMLVIATTFGVQGLFEAYLAGPERPFEPGVGWVTSWVWFVWFYVATLALPLVFPDGRLLSRRWRPVLWIGIGALVLSVAASAFADGALDIGSARDIDNPLGVEGSGQLTSWARGASAVLAVSGFLLGAVSVWLRLRRATGRDRQQVKWFVYVAALALVALAFSVTGGAVEDAAAGDPPPWAGVLSGVGWMTGSVLLLLGMPVAIAIAILWHRLYDIDLVVRRTLVYGSLTLALAGVYVAVVSLLALLNPVADDSRLAVAASTLAVAALFRPVRGRIQQVVDRRFYRSRYDAARTVESFAARLRHEVDLAAVSTDLRVVVRDTVQPTHVSLWLRGTL